MSSSTSPGPTPNSPSLEDSVRTALADVRSEPEGEDVLRDGHVRDLEVDAEGGVRFTFRMAPGDPSTLVRSARAAAEGVEGVSSVRVNVELPQAAGGGGAVAAAPTHGPAGAGAPGGGFVPKSPRKPGGLQPGSVPAPTPKPGLLGEVERIVAVSSGKGGVGKSMVAANLAAAFASKGERVGLLDADIYGPNIPTMFGETRRPGVSGERGKERIEPLEAHGVRIMSLGLLLEEDQPAIMRGPLISGILKQFLEQVAWGPLDLMVVDLPPGTGDAQLSLVQTIDLDGAVLVTTPQKVSTGDVRRAAKMFERVNTRVLGIVENMSGLQLPDGSVVDVFGRGGGRALAEELELPFLGEVPLDPAVRESGDRGVPTVVGAPDSPAGRALVAVAEALEERLASTSRR